MCHLYYFILQYKTLLFKRELLIYSSAALILHTYSHFQVVVELLSDLYCYLFVIIRVLLLSVYIFFSYFLLHLLF